MDKVVPNEWQCSRRTAPSRTRKRIERNDPTADLAMGKSLFHRLAWQRAVLSPSAGLNGAQIWYRGLARPRCCSSSNTKEGRATRGAATNPYLWDSDDPQRRPRHHRPGSRQGSSTEATCDGDGDGVVAPGGFTCVRTGLLYLQNASRTFFVNRYKSNALRRALCLQSKDRGSSTTSTKEPKIFMAARRLLLHQGEISTYNQNH